MIEQFSVQFRKTKTTVLTKANWSADRHQSQPVGIQVKNRQISFESDWMRRWRDFFGTNHSAKLSKSKAIMNYFRHSIENSSMSMMASDA